MDFYYFSLCNFCKKPSPDLKKCAQCKAAHYCSREHQQSDWNSHKDICKTITQTNKFLVLPPDATIEDLNRLKGISAVMYILNLKRELKQAERQMLMFSKICAVCFSSDVVTICDCCLSVAYCSSEHQDAHKEAHSKFCTNLKLVLEVHQSTHKKNDRDKWVDFHVGKQPLSLPEDMESVMKLLNFDGNVDYLQKPVDFVMISELLSPVVGVVHALEKSGFVDRRRGKKRRIVIHILSKVRSCLDWSFFFKFLTHWILNLEFIEIYYIHQDELGGMQNIAFWNSCDICHLKHSRANIMFLDGDYDEMVHVVPTPTLIMHLKPEFYDFNYFHEEKENFWGLLSFRKVPVVFTSHEEQELKDIVAEFPESSIKLLVRPQENAYKSLRPTRSCKDGLDSVVYQNSFIAVIARK